MNWLSEEQLLERLGIEQADLHWLEREFPVQMQILKRGGRYHPDSVNFLSSLAAVAARGAQPDQIRAWFGL